MSDNLDGVIGLVMYLFFWLVALMFIARAFPILIPIWIIGIIIKVLTGSGGNNP